MDLKFPIEFVVTGTPVSFQHRRPEAKNEWKERVKAASSKQIPAGCRPSNARIGITLYYFPSEPMQGDVDNIVKLVLDALCAHVYFDDSQIDRIVVQRFEPGNVFGFASPGAILGEALGQVGPALYVRISNDPFEDLE